MEIIAWLKRHHHTEKERLKEVYSSLKEGDIARLVTFLGSVPHNTYWLHDHLTTFRNMINRFILANARQQYEKEQKEASTLKQDTKMEFIQTKIEHMHGGVLITGGNNITVNVGNDGSIKAEQVAEDYDEEPAPEEDGDKQIVEELRNIFFGEKEPAKVFLDKIKGLEPVAITKIVKQMVANREIEHDSAKKRLWSILNKHNLYKPKLRNWNAQIG